MKVNTAKFIGSFPGIKIMPPGAKPEFAFIGRSNVGKSSLINMLTDHKKLAKVSGTPGKTRDINLFRINEAWDLIDLPGYGYAKHAKSKREAFEHMITEYLLDRENLYCVMVLIDSRIPPQKIDLDFINWLGTNEVPFVIVYTKADKQTKNKTIQNTKQFEKALLQIWEALPQSFITSSVSKDGKDELLTFIGETVEKE